MRDADGDELWRGTQKQDGHWVWCTKFEEGVGDNIDLMREEVSPGMPFREAVFAVLGGCSEKVDVRGGFGQKIAQNRNVSLPGCDAEDMVRGQEYLQERGISMETIHEAERQGMLTYCPDGVVFVGRNDEGTPKSATRRAWDEDAPVPKRDFAGSDKSYAPRLEGESEKIVVVEGGIDALAAWDMAARRGHDLPTVLVSGGSNCRAFIDRENLDGKQVVVILENEKDQATQKKTDVAHEKQAAKIADAGGQVQTWRPPQGDIADLNLDEAVEAKRAEEERKRQEEERLWEEAAKQEAEQEQEHDYGMGM